MITSPTRLHDYGPWGFVTGATEGIGRAIAVELGRAGFNLVLVARRPAALDTVANSLTNQFDVETLCLAEDLAEPAAVERIAERTAHLDIGLAVMAAGFGSVGEFVQSDLNTELDMIAVNVSAVMALAHLFARRLVARGRGGLVLFVPSWAGRAHPYRRTTPPLRRTYRFLLKGCTPNCPMTEFTSLPLRQDRYAVGSRCARE